jgi:hypothetical protein
MKEKGALQDIVFFFIRPGPHTTAIPLLQGFQKIPIYIKTRRKKAR